MKCPSGKGKQIYLVDEIVEPVTFLRHTLSFVKRKRTADAFVESCRKNAFSLIESRSLRLSLVNYKILIIDH